MSLVWLPFLLSLTFFTSEVVSQESVQFLSLQDSSSSENLDSTAGNESGLAVRMENEHLKNVSRSVLTAETWLRAHVLAHYPAVNVRNIVAGNGVFCNEDQERNLLFVLPAIKNIHFSLTRWGLKNDVKVTASFSSNCFGSESENYRNGFAQKYIEPLLHLLLEIDSPYVVNAPSPPHSDDETSILLKSHLKSMQNLGGFHFRNVKIIVSSPTDENPTTRKLKSIDLSNPFPPCPAPSRASSPDPDHSLPPLLGTAPHTPSPQTSPHFPPMFSPPSPQTSPHFPPMFSPPGPQFGPQLPPGNPPIGAPEAGVHHGLWCVAKPNVPPETLQEALDYACGAGGADCGAIAPRGTCYFPDTVLAHASYAFNSYWQKNKRNGGTCSFGGTAMLINTDPSYRQCGFILT